MTRAVVSAYMYVCVWKVPLKAKRKAMCGRCDVFIFYVCVYIHVMYITVVHSKRVHFYHYVFFAVFSGESCMYPYLT